MALNVSGDPGDARYAAVWVERPGPAWWAVHGLDAAACQARFDELTGQGYAPTILTATGPASGEIFAAAFEQGVDQPWFARHGLRWDPDTLTHENSRAYDQGYLPRCLAVRRPLEPALRRHLGQEHRRRAVLCCGGPRQGHTSGSTTRWSSGRDATAPARAVPAAVPGALRHGHPQAARRQRPPHRSGRSSDSATSSDPSSSSSVAPAPGRSSSRPRSSPTPTPACCSGRCWVRTKVAEPTVLQYAPACTCTCPLTCANADGRCRQQRRCPLYVRARGLPSADPRGQPRTLSAQPA